MRNEKENHYKKTAIDMLVMFVITAILSVAVLYGCWKADASSKSFFDFVKSKEAMFFIPIYLHGFAYFFLLCFYTIKHTFNVLSTIKTKH